MLDILQLNDMLVPELREIAEKLEMKSYKRLSKQDLIYRILDQQALVGKGAIDDKKEEAPKEKPKRKPRAKKETKQNEPKAKESKKPEAKAEEKAPETPAEEAKTEDNSRIDQCHQIQIQRIPAQHAQQNVADPPTSDELYSRVQWAQDLQAFQHEEETVGKRKQIAKENPYHNKTFLHHQTHQVVCCCSCL